MIKVDYQRGDKLTPMVSCCDNGACRHTMRCTCDSTYHQTHIPDNGVRGEVPSLKVNMAITFLDKKGKRVNGKVKATQNDGFADVLANGKTVLVIWKHKWVEYEKDKEG